MVNAEQVFVDYIIYKTYVEQEPDFITGPSHYMDNEGHRINIPTVGYRDWAFRENNAEETVSNEVDSDEVLDSAVRHSQEPATHNHTTNSDSGQVTARQSTSDSITMDDMLRGVESLTENAEPPLF